MHVSTVILAGILHFRGLDNGTKKDLRTGFGPLQVCGVALALQIKKPAAPYSRAGGSRTTLGEEALDFRVRDGNGYGRLSVATGESRSLELKRTATRERRIASHW